MRMLIPLILLSVLPSVAFAAVFNQDDIGSLIFRDFLKMTEYPGSPFSGNIINDLVMFLFIPTVFIILVIVILVLRLGLPSQRLAILMGIAFYAFIVFGGYYRIFALLAGPYFLFLIVIIGLFYFFLGHFGIGRRGLPGRAAGGGGMSGSAMATSLDDDTLASRLVKMEILVKELNAGLKEARKANDPRTADYERQVREKNAEIQILKGEIRLDPSEQFRYTRLRQKYGVS